VNDGDAPHESAGDESGKVSDHSAAKGDNRGITAESGRKQIVSQATPALTGFVRLASRDRKEIGRTGGKPG
jgi:hypothetical protein